MVIFMIFLIVFLCQRAYELAANSFIHSQMNELREKLRKNYYCSFQANERCGWLLATNAITFT